MSTSILISRCIHVSFIVWTHSVSFRRLFLSVMATPKLHARSTLLWWPTSANLRPKTRHTTPTPHRHHTTLQNVVCCHHEKSSVVCSWCRCGPPYLVYVIHCCRFGASRVASTVVRPSLLTSAAMLFGFPVRVIFTNVQLVQVSYNFSDVRQRADG